MEIEAQSLTEEQILTGQIFDRLADAYRTGDDVGGMRCRAVAAACIVAYSTGENRWYRVFDEAMLDRDTPITFSQLNPTERRYEFRTAMYEAGLLTARCKTLLHELRVLNTVG